MTATRIRDLERECTRLRGLLKGYAGGAVIDELARMDKALADAFRWREDAEKEVSGFERFLGEIDAAILRLEPSGLWIGGRVAVIERAAAALSAAHAALRAFMALDWMPDAAPGPSCYLVSPVQAARAAMVQAGIILDGKSPFPSDNDGLMSYWYERDAETPKRSVWLGGMSYGEEHSHLVPEKYRALFDEAMARPIPKREP